jgi:hypothetical protein
MPEIYRNSKVRLYARKFRPQPATPESMDYYLHISLAVGLENEIDDDLIMSLGPQRDQQFSGRVFVSTDYSIEVFDRCPQYKAILWLESGGKNKDFKSECDRLLKIYQDFVDLSGCEREKEYCGKIAERLQRKVVNLQELPISGSPRSFGLMDVESYNKLQLIMGNCKSIFS